jgi:hypothetical protein
MSQWIAFSIGAIVASGFGKAFYFPARPVRINRP